MSPGKEDMSVKYYSEDDILVIKLSKTPYDFAEKEGNFVVHFSKNNKPVRIEILKASKFIKETNSSLPVSLRRTFSSV